MTTEQKMVPANPGAPLPPPHPAVKVLPTRRPLMLRTRRFYSLRAGADLMLNRGKNVALRILQVDGKDVPQDHFELTEASGLGGYAN